MVKQVIQEVADDVGFRLDILFAVNGGEVVVLREARRTV